jgi:hypothetical protein
MLGFRKRPAPAISVYEFRDMLAEVCGKHSIKMAAYKADTRDRMIRDDTKVDVYLMIDGEMGELDLGILAKQLKDRMKREVNYFTVDPSMPLKEFKERCGTVCYQRPSGSKHFRRPRD